MLSINNIKLNKEIVIYLSPNFISCFALKYLPSIAAKTKSLRLQQPLVRPTGLYTFILQRFTHDNVCQQSRCICNPPQPFNHHQITTANSMAIFAFNCDDHYVTGWFSFKECCSLTVLVCGFFCHVLNGLTWINVLNFRFGCGFCEL